MRKFFIPGAPRLLAVFCKEVRPSAEHVAVQVLDNYSQAVLRFIAHILQQGFVGELGEGAFRKAFILPKTSNADLEKAQSSLGFIER